MERDRPAKPLTPTVMGDPVARPAKTTKGPVAPTVMPGSTPVRMVVDMDLLRRLAPGAEALTHQARSMLETLIPAHISPRQALFWQQDLQEAHGALVSDRLALLQDPVLREVPLHLARLRDLLTRFDLEAMSDGKGLVTGLLRRISGVIDTPAELASARAEIDRLLALLTQSLTPLLDLKDRLDATASRLAALENTLAVAEIAAAYLAETAAPDLRQIFKERRKSLAITLVQVRASIAEHLAQPGGLPARLVLSIQNIALVAMPAWLTHLSRFQTRLSADHRPSLTEARELGFALAKLFPLFPKPE